MNFNNKFKSFSIKDLSNLVNKINYLISKQLKKIIRK